MEKVGGRAGHTGTLGAQANKLSNKGVGAEAAACGIQDPRRTMAGWQLAAREGTVVVARGGDGDALLLAAVEPPSSSPKAPSAGSLGHEKLLASGANANGASMHAKETCRKKISGEIIRSRERWE